MTWSAGIFFSSASATTTARSTPARTALGLVGELDRARAIEEGDPVAHEFGLGDVHLDAHLMGARLRRGVADGVLVGDRALPGDRPGARQDRFKKGGLAAREWTDQCDGPRPATLPFRFPCPPPLPFLIVTRTRPRAPKRNRFRETGR